MKKLAARYPHTAVQMSRRRSLLGSGFAPMAAAATGFAAEGGLGGLASVTAPAPGDFTGAAGRASSGFAIAYNPFWVVADLTVCGEVRLRYYSRSWLANLSSNPRLKSVAIRRRSLATLRRLPRNQNYYHQKLALSIHSGVRVVGLTALVAFSTLSLSLRMKLVTRLLDRFAIIVRAHLHQLAHFVQTRAQRDAELVERLFH